MNEVKDRIIADTVKNAPERLWLNRFWQNFTEHNCQFSYQSRFDDDIEYVRADLLTADSAKRAAEEIVQRVYGGDKDEFAELEMLVAGIISKHFRAAAPADNDGEG